MLLILKFVQKNKADHSSVLNMLLQSLEKPASSVFLFQQKKLRYGRDLKELPPASIWDTLESRIQSLKE